MDKVFKAAVIGHPISHSLSPEIFKQFSKASGQKVEYQKWDVSPDKFNQQFKEKIKSAGEQWVGCNVTIPYKQRVTKVIGKTKHTAVNVIKKTAKGLVGYNTDMLGIEKTLEKHKLKLTGKNILIIGAGGAARAFCLVMSHYKVAEVHVLNRSVKNSAKLCSEMNRLGETKFVPIKEVDLNQNYYLVANATPQGMKGQPKLQYPKLVKSSKFAFDMVYRPLMTDFLKSAKKAGARPIGGLDMLVWQAWATWEIWFGTPPLHAREVKMVAQKLKRFL
jgi:shikimate dehydrogenase